LLVSLRASLLKPRNRQSINKEKTVMPIKINRPTIQARDAQVIAGINKHLHNMPSILLLGVSYTPASLVSFVQAQIDSANAATAAKVALQEAAKANQATNEKVNPVIRELRSFVINTLGPDGNVLTDFGFTLPKPRKVPLTADQAAAAKKREATREARHTMGSVQKKKVKGTVEVPVAQVAPATSPAVPAAAAPAPANGAPAPSPSGASSSHS